MVTIKKGLVVNWQQTAYTQATILVANKNGWCECQWPDGRKFKARAHWLIGSSNLEYKIEPN